MWIWRSRRSVLILPVNDDVHKLKMDLGETQNDVFLFVCRIKTEVSINLVHSGESHNDQARDKASRSNINVDDRPAWLQLK